MRHILGQDAEVRERAHEALERGRMGRPCRPGKLVHALRPLREVVSQTKFGCNATSLASRFSACSDALLCLAISCSSRDGSRFFLFPDQGAKSVIT